MRLKILVGTMTGTAESVAQAIQMDCADRVGDIKVQLMGGLDISVFDEEALFLICTSTTGAGDLPDNAQALYASLDINPKYLGSVRYGVIALGDLASHGVTFCFGGKLLDERLQGLGARRIGDICYLDASDGSVPEVEGAAWCRGWLTLAMAA